MKGMISEIRKTCAEFERMLVAAKGVCELEIKQVVAFISIFATLCMVFGCVTKSEVVTVPEVRTEHIHVTDSMERMDSLIDRCVTIIREADSAFMAQYGIWLDNAQKAWLVETNETQRKVERTREVKHDTIHITDSIPYPVPVKEYVEKELTWWQTTRIHLGEVMLVLLVLVVIIGVVKTAKYIKL